MLWLVSLRSRKADFLSLSCTEVVPKRRPRPNWGVRGLRESAPMTVLDMCGAIRDRSSTHSIRQRMISTSCLRKQVSARRCKPTAGSAPVTEQSGKQKSVHFRWACPKFLRQSFHEWAGHSIAHSQWARSYYQQQRKRGKGHHAVVRGLAFNWIRIVFRCWKDRVAYDESRYLTTLAKRNSPLVAIAGGTIL
jgi:hypothetical protein